MVRLFIISILFFNINSYSAFADDETITVNAGVESNPLLPFLPSDDVMRDVDETLMRAKEEGKIALIIMGANWCHDSRGLAHHLTDPAISKFVSENYETIFVDVGFLDKSFEVIKRFGMPVIYGTPTVLFIDPENNNVLNKAEMNIWRDAYKMSLYEVGQYFRKMAKPGAREMKAEVPTDTLVALLDQIDNFEDEQAQRIYKGFSIVGPILKSDDRSEKAMEKWVVLSKFRYKITEDLAKLRADARKAVMAGDTNYQIKFPVYGAFDWEG